MDNGSEAPPVDWRNTQAAQGCQVSGSAVTFVLTETITWILQLQLIAE
jgi:hypothetical protein